MKSKSRKLRTSTYRSKTGAKAEALRVIILGAGGRDFHNFNTFFRNRPNYQVVAFTATQIPFIANRIYPPELAGANYPQGIPIYPEEELPRLLSEDRIDQPTVRATYDFDIDLNSLSEWLTRRVDIQSPL